ncbi:ABC transporter transmembrane region [Ceratobasidium sp. AG-Ba]|nr:ABC transporter transmembrane region [Ceratobasidium sp. AG-Ba]QRW14625.1 ABC transporter transmembrane region [Ceratobasidium sp. AG-Ba]
MSQLVLGIGLYLPAVPTKAGVGTHALLIPIVCAAVSAVLLLAHVFVFSGSIKRYSVRPHGQEDDDNLGTAPVTAHRPGFFTDLRDHVCRHGSTAIFIWKVLRLASCIALTVLTIIAIVLINEGKQPEKHEHRTRRFSNAEWVEVSLCVFYTYTTLLAIFALTLINPRLRGIVNFHLVALLLIAFGIYTWRDLLPLATFSSHPADTTGGWLTWSRIGVLSFAAVIIPLWIPRPHMPSDSKNPTDPNPEQTASLISLVLFNFLDPLVWTAYRAQKLEYEQLPPLADDDRAVHLKKRSFDKLDPLRRSVKNRRHLFWGLMEVFRKEFCIMAVMVIVRSVAEFAAPVSIRYLLMYLENPTEPGMFRPWVWIAWLLLGPLTASIAMEWYLFINTRSSVRAEGMLTQLLFEHSLRIRMVAEVAPSKTGSAEVTTFGGETASVSEEIAINQTSAGHPREDSMAHTVEGGNAHTLAEGANTVEDIVTARGSNSDDGSTGDGDDPDESNLVGKINNLMSTDLENIVEGQDFLMIFLLAPIQIIISVVLLYQILGSSAIIGMVVMILSCPVPGKTAQLLNDVQIEEMKKTDARVQGITEYMNVIRMIKLFGWEAKIQRQGITNLGSG